MSKALKENEGWLLIRSNLLQPFQKKYLKTEEDNVYLVVPTGSLKLPKGAQLSLLFPKSAKNLRVLIHSMNGPNLWDDYKSGMKMTSFRALEFVYVNRF